MAQSADPLAPGFALSSGMDRAFAEVAARRAAEKRCGRLVLRMPGEAGEDPGRVPAAVGRYCAARRAELAVRKAATWREGLQTLWLALGFIAVCVLGAVAAEAWLEGPGIAPSLVRDGLVIAGWVALWRPIDMLLFDTWLLRREGRVLDAVSAMPVVVAADGGAIEA